MKTRLTIMHQKRTPRSVRLKLLMPDGSLETLSLRDLFAGLALPVSFSITDMNSAIRLEDLQPLMRSVAETCYRLADAMLTTREKAP